MLGAKLAAQVLIAASGCFSGDSDAASPLTSDVQRRPFEDRQRILEEQVRELEALQRKGNQVARQLHEETLSISRLQLAETQQALKSLDIVGPPTKIGALFLRLHQSSQRDLEQRIKQYEAELMKLGPPPKPESK